MSIFYKKNMIGVSGSLSEKESKHCVLVLRHKKGDELLIFDGIGGKYHSILTEISKKRCEFEVITSFQQPKKKFSVHLGIAPSKNADRMEWLIEKLAESGVDEVTFLETFHSERKKFRLERLEKKAINAMKQSGNPFLLQIHPITKVHEFIKKIESKEKFIASVDSTQNYLGNLIKHEKKTVILIGPEGDFNTDELTFAQQHGYQPVSLGENVLRTETAGLYACLMAHFVNSQ